MKIDVCLGDELRTFYASEADGSVEWPYSHLERDYPSEMCWTVETHSDELK